MYAWQIVPVTSKNNVGYAWQWKREDGKGKTSRVSDAVYDYYYDCVMDAKKHGYDPDVPRRMR